MKVSASFFFAVLVAVERRWTPLAYAAVLPVLLASFLGPRAVGRRLIPVNGFLAMLWLVLPFSYPGHKLLSLGPITATREGVGWALMISIKSNLIVSTSVGLLGTSPIFHIVHALHHLRLPSKLTQMFFFSFRYIHVIYQEYLRLHRAMKVRAFKPRNDLHTYRSYAYLVGMLILRSYERSKRIHQAMLLRGFRGTFWTLHHFRARRSDIIVGAFLGLYLGGMVWLSL